MRLALRYLILIVATTAACGEDTKPPSSIGGTVSGLEGTGLVLHINGEEELAISSNGPFAFSTPIAFGQEYAVAVSQQPSSPAQTCVVTNGTGTTAGTDVSDVSITCMTGVFTIGGTVTGLQGSGLVLQNNGTDDLTITSDGSFEFAVPLASGTAFAVAVQTQPTAPSQTCAVTMATGTVVDAHVTSVRVDCTTNKYTVGGTVTGLAGTGLVLQNSGGDDLAISADGSFTFTTPVSSGQTYAVTALALPASPTQVCTVTNGTGSVGAANVTDVQVTCETSSFTIGGMLTGLAGSGLVLRNNGGDDLTVSANGAFTFTTPVASGASYNVTIASQPSGPSQTCTVMGNTGTVGGANVTSVAINCTTNAYMIGGTISGLAGTVVLQNNAGDDLSVTANGSFAFAIPVLSGGNYAVTVLANPATPSQTCTVTNASGSVDDANVTSVTVTCTTNTYKIGGTLSGLASGESVVLRNNGGDDLTLSANGSFAFTTPIASGSMYEVTILTNPTTPIAQTCTATNDSGIVGSADVTGVVVTCTTNQYTVGGTVVGLTGSGLVLRNNGGNDLAISANGSFTFTASVASGTGYAVTVLTQPTGQICSVTNASGTIAGADVTNVSVSCVAAGACDSFTAPNGTTVPNWTENVGNWVIDTNRLRINQAGGIYSNNITMNGSTQLDGCGRLNAIHTGAAAGQVVGVVLRWQGPTNYIIALVQDNSNSGNFNSAWIYQMPLADIGGAIVGQNFGTSPNIEACVNGTTVTLRVDANRDGTYEVTRTGTTTITNAGLTGVMSKSDSSSTANMPRVDAFCWGP